MANWKDPQVFAIWLIVISSIFLLLSVFIILLIRTYLTRIYNEKEKASLLKINFQKQLVRDSIIIQESERERIAADLHDSLISKLNSIKFMSYKFIDNNMSNSIIPDIEDSIRLTRGISHDLCPPMVESSDVLELIDSIFYPYLNKFKVEIFVSGKEYESIKKENKLQISRIVQELLNNIVKHSEASRINVNIHFGSSFFALFINDNGVGYNVDELSSGLGAKNIVLRTQYINAYFKTKSKINLGSSFTLITSKCNL